MKIFLKLKHWQLFALVFGITLIYELFFMDSILVYQNHYMSVKVLPLMMVLLVGPFFAWFYAMGTNLYNKLPATVNMNLSSFKLFLFVPIGYILLLSFCMIGMFVNSSNDHYINPMILILMVPLHLFVMFCIFYCLYFISKLLKAVELQRSVTFNDYAGEFFLIWFFPIGVWFIQPRVNKIFEAKL